MKDETMPESRPTRYLNLGWRVMVVWGVGVALVGVAVSLLNHLVSPQILYYTPADAEFTGVSWSKLVSIYPNLGSWLILFFDTTTSQLLFYGILTVFISATAYRLGERWAWISLLVSFLVTFAHLIPTFTFISGGVLVNSGISIGIVGILITLIFLVTGLILPGTELLGTPKLPPASKSIGSRKLSISWMLLFIFVGALNVAFALYVPLMDHISYVVQTPPTYGTAADALFSGASWQQIMSLSPTLGLWVVLQMDNMCAGMIGGGILASAVSVKGFRNSRRWAWYALLLSLVVYYVPFFLSAIPFYQAGVYSTSTVSSGLPPDPTFYPLFLVFIGLPVLALLLPITQFRLRTSMRKLTS